MERFIENYQGKEFDLVVIGGGITGATVAYEAASRGLLVALIEKSDFGSATSAATSKMIHGGLRYLSTYEFGLVRESLKERRVLTNIAPNFIHPASFLFAIYKKDKVSNFMMKIGMLLYELFSFDKNRLWDKSKKMPHHKSVSSEQVLNLFPNALKDGLMGGQMYYDCSSHSPERFTLAFIKSAVKYGASVTNYTKVEDFIVDEHTKMKTVKGVRVIDELSGKKHNIKANLVINCSGPWADILLDKVKKNHDDQELRRSEGIHFVIKKLTDKHIFSGYTALGKHYFLVPYRNHTLIGTTDKEFIGNPDDYKVTKKAIVELLDDVNNSFGNSEKIKYEDILYTYGGLRPLVEDQTEDVYHSSRKYEITGEKKNGIEGLITVEGGKFTTSRMLAEKAIDKALKILKFPKKKSISENSYLYASNIDNFDEFVAKKQKEYPEFLPEQIENLTKCYGTEINELFSIIRENENYTALNKDGENLAQVQFAIRNEMAVTLPDIMLRRTGMAQLGHPGKETMDKVAKLAAKELGWDNEKLAIEIGKMESILQIPK
ncbi:MAG: glycerol-3-phosphate dehydrogenase [Bacteroidetes bacterium]|nr:MAG: glycerol-3-phosphate dehydrogenase [Bacteroidota bacterium]